MNFYKLNNSVIDNEKQLIYKEKITLYSYYILKCRLLFNINRFFKFCFKTQYQKIGESFNSNKTINKFTDFILDEIYNIEEQLFESVLVSQRSSDNIFFNNKDWNNSLRMTYYKEWE